MKLTENGRLTVAKLRARYAVLEAEYGVNAVDRLVIEHGDIPKGVIMCALDRASFDDCIDMLRHDYAEGGVE